MAVGSYSRGKVVEDAVPSADVRGDVLIVHLAVEEEKNRYSGLRETSSIPQPHHAAHF